MFTHIKRIITTATLIIATAAPTAAFARLNLDPPGPDTSATSVPTQVAPPVAKPAASSSSSNGFEWGDAGIGGAVVLALVSVGSGTAAVRKRRQHVPLPN